MWNAERGPHLQWLKWTARGIRILGMKRQWWRRERKTKAEFENVLKSLWLIKREKQIEPHVISTPGQTFPPNLTTVGVCVLYTHWSWKNTWIPKQSPLSLHHRRCFVGFVSKIRHYDCNVTRYSLSLSLWPLTQMKVFPQLLHALLNSHYPPFFFLKPYTIHHSRNSRQATNEPKVETKTKLNISSINVF